jgi:hypothetical protein
MTDRFSKVRAERGDGAIDAAADTLVARLTSWRARSCSVVRRSRIGAGTA